MEEIALRFNRFTEDDMQKRAKSFRAHMVERRTVRAFDERPIPPSVLDDALQVAASAPSGANRQPWRFVVIEDPNLKRRIRSAAEKEEREFYSTRAPDEWLEALEPLGTDENKPFLTEAPALIAIFLERFGIDSDGNRVKNYYMTESVGIATGFLISALHHAGLATLTHTPSPMRFLNEILDRPTRERPYLLLVVGYPKNDATVPAIERLPIETVVTHL
ncbi:MAG: nitroreductase family protein [Gammaproteobacteria bacterium]|nr:nitroreductase family protein [Gammaproteobacteria bacterium]